MTAEPSAVSAAVVTGTGSPGSVIICCVPDVTAHQLGFIPLQVNFTQALQAFRDANKSSSLVDDWKGPSEQWRGLKTEEGELTEL